MKKEKIIKNKKLKSVWFSAQVRLFQHSFIINKSISFVNILCTHIPLLIISNKRQLFNHKFTRSIVAHNILDALVIYCKVNHVILCNSLYSTLRYSSV